MGAFAERDDPVVAAMREALGAVAVAEPATYWLLSDAQGVWSVRQEGHGETRRFAHRERALAFIRLAVVRCSSYCLCLQGIDGRIIRRIFIGCSAEHFLQGRSAQTSSAHMHP